MKLGCISDLHIDINIDFSIINTLCSLVEETRLDCLLIAGDISNNCRTTIETIEKIKDNIGIPVYFVPGNHDLWDEAGEYNNTNTIYSLYQNHPLCLSGGAKLLDDQWALIGDVGWYDYSFGSDYYTFQEFEQMQAFDRTWKDSQYVKWGKSNREMSNFFLKKLSDQLGLYKDKKLILVTHMLSRKEFTVRDGRELWQYFNAFLGSSRLGDLFERYRVSYAVMGHVHYRLDQVISAVHYICPCLGYSTEWKSQPADCREELRKSLYVLDTGRHA